MANDLGRVGKYQLIKRLAIGGMAEIFLARQTGLQEFEKLVVLKRILPNLANQERFVQMFLHEARLAARFNHPNIAQIYDLGRDGDTYFIAMEFVHGEDIKSIVRRCAKRHLRIPVEHVVKIASGVLGGLYSAHSHVELNGEPGGVVHRDVSPHNIIVSFQGAIKLVDFGIAKARTEISTTVPGRVKGKHAYMSPEQVHGRDLDGRSDIFAVGTVMYELLTWTRLFKRNSHLETLRAVSAAEVRPPSELNPEIDSDLEAIVLKSLQRDRERRYQTAQEMQIELEDYLVNNGLKSNPVLLARFMEDLFSDKLAALREALTVVKAPDLEQAILAAPREGAPDLVAFLDMFFGDSSSMSSSSPAQPAAWGTGGGADMIADDFYDIALPAEADLQAPAAAPARREERPQAPPDWNAVVMEAPDPGLPPPSERDLLDPAQPMSEPIFDPSDYAHELSMMEGKKTGRGFLVTAFLLLLIAGGALLFVYRDKLTQVKTPEFGFINVNSVPTGADVYLDNQRQPDTTPTQIRDIRAGETHTIRVSYPDLPDWEKQVTLTDTTQPLVLDAVLDGAAVDRARMSGESVISETAGEGTGNLSVHSQPAGALIFLDGISTGRRTPAVFKRVPAGLDHVVLLDKGGRQPAFQRFHLDAGQDMEVKLDLPQGVANLSERIMVHVESEPEGATVRVNGFPLKKTTPVAVKLLAGQSSEIEVEKKPFATYKRTVRPVPNVDLIFFAKLKK